MVINKNKKVNFLEKTEMFSSKEFKIVKKSYSFSSKSICKTTIISRPISVIIPVIDDNKIVFVDQYRYGINANLLELPAGTNIDNESPLDCAKRELEEETGYRAEKWKNTGSFYSSPGLNNELIYCFLAKGLYKTNSKLDHDEILKIKFISINKLQKQLFDGKFKDAKTIAGLMRYLIKNE